MKKILLVLLLCFAPFGAHAEDVIELEGNTKVITGGGNSGRTYVYRNYDTDDLIKRRLLGYDDRFYRRNNNRIPSNDYSTICGGADRASERRRCRDDVRDLDKDRAELYRKYND